MDKMFFEDFLSHFKVVQRYNNKAQCKCPAHNDKQASLTISIGTKNTNAIIMKCHAGCTNSEILSAAGLAEKDMFEINDDIKKSFKPNWKSYIENRENKKIEARYDYRSSLNGSYVFSKIRLEGKKIIYGRFENDRFIYGLNGKRGKDYKAIYGDLNRIRKAIETNETIFITEGEKDTDTMLKYGYIACSYGSSSDWQKALAEVFRNGNIIILADNDKSGKEVAQKILEDTQGIVKTARIIIPTPTLDKGDISDYFIDHTKEDFENLLNININKKPDKEETDIAVFDDNISNVGFIENVRDMLLYDDVRDKNGNIKNRKLRNIVRNVEIVLENDIRFKNKVRFNEFSHQIDIIGLLPWKADNLCRTWGNSDDASLFSLLQCDYGFTKREDCIDALEITAHRNSYNPVKEILESLEYKGEGFVRKLLPCYLGCKDAEYTYQVMLLFMLGAVNRIYSPGCKFDYTLMLQGAQGLGKSTFLQLLALDDSWFNDSLDSLDNKDSVQGLIGSWIVELAELKSFTRTAGGTDSIKRFLTATQDKARLPYCRRVELFPRSCVFAGTTNRADFLTDETGNRRFLVVNCGQDTITKNLFDKEEIMPDIKGAWAEVMYIFKNENRALILPREFEIEAKQMQEQCLVEDTRRGLIGRYLEDKDRVCVVEVWQEALKQEGTPKKHQSTEIAEIVRSLGFAQLSSPRKCGIYGSQRVFERISKDDNSGFQKCAEEVPFSA